MFGLRGVGLGRRGRRVVGLVAAVHVVVGLVEVVALVGRGLQALGGLLRRAVLRAAVGAFVHSDAGCQRPVQLVYVTRGALKLSWIFGVKSKPNITKIVLRIVLSFISKKL